MSNFVSSAAHAASKALVSQGVEVKRSQISEVLAALLGYRTFAALAVERADTSLEYQLDDAEIVVLNLPLGEWRVAALGIASVARSAIVEACATALKASLAPMQVFLSVDDFYDSHAREVLADTIYNADDVAGAMAGSNASFVDDPEMEDTYSCLPTADLWEARDTWKIEADGDLTGEYDPEGDRMFNGETLNCRGRLTYRKAGRAGLVFLEGEGFGVADDSWREQDLEDELT